MGEPKLEPIKDALVGTLDYNGLRVAAGTMGYDHKALAPEEVRGGLAGPNFLLKIIPHADGAARISELVRYTQSDLAIKGAWSGPGGLQLFARVGARRRAPGA